MSSVQPAPVGSSSDQRAMDLVAALRVLHGLRTDRDVVIPTMSSAREWMKLGSHPLDFIYAPSAMGQAPSLGLGVAMGRPDYRVIVCNGDGCLLMNLGCLVTIATAAPKNYVLLSFDNGVYEVTGSQLTAASRDAKHPAGAIDYCGLARSCGFREVHAFDNLASWTTAAADVCGRSGPVFVSLKVHPIPGGMVPKSPAPAKQRTRDFAAQLS